MNRDAQGSAAVARVSGCNRRATPWSRRPECCPRGSAIWPVSQDHGRKSQPWGIAGPGLSNVIDRGLADADRYSNPNPNPRCVTFALASATLTGTAGSGVTGTGPA